MTRHNVPTPVNLRSRLQAVVGCRSDLQMPSGPGGDYPLLNGLAEYYEGNEASGPMLGSINGLDATANNSPGTTTGPGGSAVRSFLVGSNQWFGTPSDDGFTFDGRNLYIGAWLYLDSLPSIQVVIAGSVNPFVYQFSVGSDGTLFCDGWGLNGAGGTPHLAGFTAAMWHFVELRMDGDLGRFDVALDGSAWSGGTFTSFNSQSQHAIGLASRSPITGTYPFTGAMGGVLITRTIPSDDARAWLRSANRVRTALEVSTYAG